MAVEVITGHDGFEQTVETYDSGKYVYVEEGHLEIRGASEGLSGGSIIAVFAPSKWDFARVIETEKG